MMQRATAAGILAPGITIIENPSFSDDAEAALGIAEALGARVNRSRDFVRIEGGGVPVKFNLDCRESGLALRMFTAIASMYNNEFTLSGDVPLLSRPLPDIEEPLRELGAEAATSNGFAPLTVRGPLTGGPVEVDGSISSQFISGLLMALPLCKKNSLLKVRNLKSRPYLQMTLDLLEHFQIKIDHDASLSEFSIPGNQRYKAAEYFVEGDWSGASFLLTAGAIAGRAEVRGLDIESSQADRAILDALRRAGAGLEIKTDRIIVQKKALTALEFDATDCPDLFPPLAALASRAKGKSVIHGAKRLVHKESNRALALAEEFGKLGIEVSFLEDRLEITGAPMIGGEVDSHGDHRIAMACAIAALSSRYGVSITNPECVAKSYPSFFEDIEAVSVRGK